MSVTLKIILENDIRRLTLADQPNIEKLNTLIVNLFVAELSNSDFVIKYKDDDGDFVSVTHERELSEAWNLAANKTPSLLRLTVTKTAKKAPVAKPAPVPAATKSVKPAPKKAKKAPRKQKKVKKAKKAKKARKPRKKCAPKKKCCPVEQKCNDISKMVLELVDKALVHPEIVTILRKFNINPVVLRAQIMLISPFLKLEYLKPFLKMENLVPFAKTMLSQFGDFGDVDLSCFDKLSNINVCDEAKTFLDEFGLTELIFGKNEEEEEKPESSEPKKVRHAAICDHCDQHIFGIRYKCAVCPDYDLCEKCEVNSTEVHDADHVFLKLLKPQKVKVYRAGRRGRRGCPGRRRQRAPADIKIDAKLVADVTIEDGYMVEPEAEFMKVWTLQNIGNTAWPEGTKLVGIGGTTLAFVDFVNVQSVEPGQSIDISVDMRAPKEAGRYISTFRLQQPDGSFFGHRVWCDIIVVESEAEPIDEEIKGEAVVIETVNEDDEVVDTTVVDTEEKVEEDENVIDSVAQGILEQLASMGFIDRDTNLELIKKYGNDMMSIVNNLIN